MAESSTIQKPSILSDLMGKDLPGWQIIPAYFLEKKHGLMGTFPATLAGDNDSIILVLEKRLLREVWNRVTRAHAKITTITVLANKRLGIAFDIGEWSNDREPFRLFSEANISELCQQDKPFEWCPGLYGALDPNAEPPDFDS